MKRIQSILLAVAMLLAAPAFFTSCQEDAPEINYTMNVSVINDFTKVVEAINNGALKNEEAIKKLTEAIDKMNVDQAAKLQAIADVLNSVNATLETKLAALDAAIQAQTLELSGKLVLLETAVKNQTLKIDEMGRLIATAIDNSRDEISKKLEALRAIIESTAKTQAEKLEAIKGAVEAQTLSLETKLDLLETAVKNQTLKLDEMGRLIATAIDNSRDELSKKLKAIEEIIKSTSEETDKKLEAIEGAIRAQTLSLETKLDLLTTAINNLPDYTAQLKAIKKAIKNLPDYTAQLAAIQAAIAGMPDYTDKFKGIIDGLGEMKTELQNLGTGQGNIVTAINNATTEINKLVAAVNSGNTAAAAALAQIIQKLGELKATIGSGGGGPTMEFVDLGLPSGLKWAKCNLGASTRTDYGDYYAWGEIVPNKGAYSWATYKWMQPGQAAWKFVTKYTCDDGKSDATWYDASGNFIGDGKTTLEGGDDAATTKLSSPWRMPTKEELDELRTKCNWTWTTLDGKNGWLGIGPNGNSIFLPAAGYRDENGLQDETNRGYYWSSSLNTAFSSNGCNLRFDSSNGNIYENVRYFGFSVRAVRP